MQVEYHIKVDYSNVKHHGGTPLPEAEGSYIIPRRSSYHYLYFIPLRLSCSISGISISPYPLGPSVSVHAAVRFLLLPFRSRPIPFPLYSPTIYLRFLGY